MDNENIELTDIKIAKNLRDFKCMSWISRTKASYLVITNTMQFLYIKEAWRSKLSGKQAYCATDAKDSKAKPRLF